jgi:hypothetical protein
MMFVAYVMLFAIIANNTSDATNGRAMAATSTPTDGEILDWTTNWLGARVPRDWSLTRASSRQRTQEPEFTLTAPHGGSVRVALLIRDALQPADVPQLAEAYRDSNNAKAFLVVAPWLSSRTRELLAAQGVSHLDLTGNARLNFTTPAVFIETQGADHNPTPRERSRARVHGPKAGRLVRYLLDTEPPFGVREIADLAGLNPGYVSRLLDSLEREAIVSRSPRGRVESVEIAALARRWSENYDLIRSNRSRRFIAPGGLHAALDDLVRVTSEYAVTGSFAAARLRPIAPPSLLCLFTRDPDDVIRRLGLIPSDRGANVVLLEPFDDVVYRGAITEKGLTYVSASQSSIDCLSGNGRMPAEGEAVVAWMQENENLWRRPAPERS